MRHAGGRRDAPTSPASHSRTLSPKTTQLPAGDAIHSHNCTRARRRRYESWYRTAARFLVPLRIVDADASYRTDTCAHLLVIRGQRREVKGACLGLRSRARWSATLAKARPMCQTCTSNRGSGKRECASGIEQVGLGKRDWASGIGQVGLGKWDWASGTGQAGLGKQDWASGTGQAGLGKRDWASGTGQAGLRKRDWASGTGQAGLGKRDCASGIAQAGLLKRDWQRRDRPALVCIRRPSRLHRNQAVQRTRRSVASRRPHLRRDRAPTAAGLGQRLPGLTALARAGRCTHSQW